MTQRIIITPGEPAGVGPELCLQLAQAKLDDPALAALELTLVADPRLLEQRAAELGLPLRLRELDAQQLPPARATGNAELGIIPIAAPLLPTPGRPETANAPYLLDSLRCAVQLCHRGEAAAMVTGPLQKSIINDAGIAFSGHTEFLAELCGGVQTVMMLATEGLRVALVTTHLPLRDVADQITPERLQRVIDVLHQDLQQRFGLTRPRIAVCGLNPHAGEGGHLGREEIDIITPVLDSYRARGMQLQGPLPADTLFTDHILSHCDAVLAMYHDQGLPVLKYRGFGRAANITLGLPIVRTSVDHGTALDLAGSGRADSGSLRHAIITAAEMSQHHE